MKKNIKLTATKKPLTERGFDVSVEFVLTAERTDKKSLSLFTVISKPYQNLINHKQTFSIAARYAVEYARFISPAYQKAISNQRLSQLTNYAEFAAHDKGKGKMPVNESMSCQRIGKKAFYVTCMESNPYHLIRWIAGWVCLVFLGVWLIDAVHIPR